MVAEYLGACINPTAYTSLPPFRPQTQEDSDESMMATKQGVSMMQELYEMHVCMMHVLCNKYQISGQLSKIVQ